MTSSKPKSVASSLKLRFWLPVIIAIALLKGQVAKAQYSSLDFDQGCVDTCFAGYQTALGAYCPGSNEENGVYDCTATSCDMTKEVANMYVAGYMMQVAKANNTFCLGPGKNSTTSSTVTRSSAPLSTQTIAPTVVKTTKPSVSTVVASTNTTPDVNAIETGADGKPLEKPSDGVPAISDVSNSRSTVMALQLVLVGVGITIFA